jgi:hypothetical protein
MTPNPSTTPNLYELSGNNLHITYSTTSLDGKPHFTYQDAQQTLNFRGDDIRATATEIGTLVSVTTRRTVDTGSTTFTVLIPNVGLDPAQPAHIRTEGITTLHRFSVIPAFNHGQKDIYTVVPLSGTARFVMF